MSIQVVPSVSMDALSASSMNSEGETISLTEPVFDTLIVYTKVNVCNSA